MIPNINGKKSNFKTIIGKPNLTIKNGRKRRKII
jgi:hypothetical protein